MSPFVWLQLVALSVIWGLSFVLVGASVHEIGAIQVAWARMAGGALFMLAFCLVVGQSLRATPRFWLAALAMGLANNVVPFTLICFGQIRIGAELAAILNATTPFFAAIVAHLFTGDERITANRLAGIAIGIGAAAVLVGPAAWEAIALAGSIDSLLGQAMILGASLSYACAGVFGKRFRGTAPSAVATSMLVLATLMMTPLMLWAGAETLLQGSLRHWAILGLLGVLGTGIAYILYFRVLAAAGATNVLLVTLLVPFSTAALSFLILDSALGLRAAIALALISLGLLVFDGRLAGVIGRRLRRARA